MTSTEKSSIRTTSKTQKTITRAPTKNTNFNPGTIKVGEYNINIEVVDKPAAMCSDYDPEVDRLYGVFVTANLTIYIEDNLDITVYKDVLWHEILHAIWFATGMHAIDQTNYSEELMVSLLTPGLLRFYKDNKEVMEFLSD